MAVMKKSVRKKLSKYLEKLIKKHGAEMTLALVTGIVSSIAADDKAKSDRAKARKAAKEGKAAKPGKVAKAEKADRAKPEKVARPDKAVRTDLDDQLPEYGEGGRRARGAGKRTER